MERKAVASEKLSQKRKLPNHSSKNQFHYDMIVFCHLRWSFVYQRPQHIITRMAKEYKILFVEEPVPFGEGEENTFEMEEINQNLHILKPKTKDIAGIRQVLKSILKSKSFEIGWFYSASFSPLISNFSFERIVYDCMDELSLFKGAPAELIDQEKFLMSEADIVFTGGKSLYDSKSGKHANVHCFPSSVEREHFGKALSELEIPDDIKHMEKSIVGYFGVIDERINMQLLHKVSTLNPNISFVMIGPVAKIGEEDLPRESNIHYLGMKSYEKLPNYLKAFDIAMMPFALSDATKYISPTKTLEYMAAGKPIISTAIKDVERDYSHCILIIATAEEFSRKIKEILQRKEGTYTKEYEDILNKTSWDSTAKAMNDLIKTTV